ncbi:MAG: hypothetical protein HDR38_07240 [Treponema sp.]|nr:hypothetical protein [Treponema sp.]
MKKIFSLMLLLATMMVFLPSCSKDDDEPEDIKTQMIGTWDATSVKFSDSDWVDITNYPSMALSITFNKDGSYSGRGALGNGSGTYTVSGRTIKTYVGEELYGTYYVNSISGNKAELKLTMGSTSMDIRATKR